MNRKTRHKFREKMELTYEQYFRDRCDEMVHLARELERILGRKKALEIMGKARKRYIVKLTRKEMAEKGPIKSFEDFKTREKNENASRFFSHILTLTYAGETSKELTLHVTECLWAKMFRKMNAADLGYVMFCNPDFAYAQACHPKIRMRRTKTLMQGDSYCNHTFYWEE